MSDTIIISRFEYERLIKDSEWLECLEAAGVDNWQGYDVAAELYNKLEQEGEIT